MSSTRKPNRRFPRRVELALNPVERVVALYDGQSAIVAEKIGIADRTVKNRRNLEGGDWTAEQVTSLEVALAMDGWLIPDGFLTDPVRIFKTPDRVKPDAALAALEARRLAAQEAGHAAP